MKMYENADRKNTGNQKPTIKQQLEAERKQIAAITAISRALAESQPKREMGIKNGGITI